MVKKKEKHQKRKRGRSVQEYGDYHIYQIWTRHE